jgi:Txe/YoeB family toxin of Txe-Axe toxin-antitoxin module
MSDGEKAFAQVFQFAPFVPQEDHDELRDFLYKFAHNFKEAQEYLQILKQVDDIDFDQKSELLFRVQAMALQCFPLAMRRMTDNISKRSLQKLVTKAVRDEFKVTEINKIKEIHSHYKLYVDKGVAHQDEVSVKENLEAFPDTSVIDADMKYLNELYNKLVKEICTGYIKINGKPHDYEDELMKLIVVS